MNVRDFKALSERATLIISAANEKYVLKKKGSLEQFEKELKLLKHLGKNKFPTQIPLYTKFGDLMVNYKNANYCIYNYIYGETFSATETLQNSMIPKLLGETIATLNKAMNSINFAIEFPQKDVYHMVYGYAVNEIKKVDNSKKLLKVYQQLEDDIKKVVESLPKQLIHRDSHIHNIVFKGGLLSGVIDFDIAEINVNTFDICYCSTSVLSEVFSKENLRGKWINFVGDLVTGYNLYNPLSFSEIKSLWYIMLCIQTVFMSYFSNNKEIYEVNKEMFLWVYENRINIENTILQGVR
ncbi:phosphotransferase [Alkalihalobacterium bogoriense]|uniref:phosphotransferase n=1 Tax=Alkalihalobacterium bogoriense TaxID=246272 RepID=UPI000A049B57|nr:phosphotransferase [Alkalihalobacterium bogoriense]